MPSRRRVPKPAGCHCKGHVEDDFRRLSPRQRFTRCGSGDRSISSKIPLQVRTRMRYLIVLAALLLAGPFAASAQEPDPASDQVMHVLVTCLHAAARRLDDGRSDAATVALSIRSACVPEYFTARSE